MSEYHYVDGSQTQQGPFTKDEMHALLDERRIGQNTPEFRAGDTKWRTAHQYPELAMRKPKLTSNRSARSSVP